MVGRPRSRVTDGHGELDGRHSERQRDRTRRDAEGRPAGYARSIGLKDVDDLKKPELLTVVKDKVYAEVHGGKHRDGSSAGKTRAGSKRSKTKSGTKADSRNGDTRNGDTRNGDTRNGDSRNGDSTTSGGGNSTADTPNVSESALTRMRKGDLQDYARSIGLREIDDLKKPELLAEVKDKVYADAHGGRHRSR